MPIRISSGSEQRCFIYGLVDPRTEKIRYVGKSVNPEGRLKAHLNFQKPRNHKENWLNRLRSLGLRPALRIIEETTVVLASDREIHWIAQYRLEKSKLTNATDGGDGAIGLVWTDDMRKAISLRSKNNRYAIGHVPSEEARKLMSDGAKSQAKRTGLSPTPETRRRMRNSQLGRKTSEETKAKMRASHARRKQACLSA